MKENLEEEQNKVKELSEKVSQLETEVDEKSQEIQIAGKKSANLVRNEFPAGTSLVCVGR